MEHTLASTAALRIYEPSPPFMLVRFPPLLSKALDQLLSAPPGEQEPPTAIGVLGADLKVIHINPDLVASKSEASKKMPKQCAGESRVQTNTLGMEIICRIYDEGIYGARTTTNAVLFAKPPTYINFTWPVKYLKARLTPDPERPQSKLAKKTPSRAAALDNDNVFFKYFDQGVRTSKSLALLQQLTVIQGCRPLMKLLCKPFKIDCF
eukprot:Gregarina_sp_Poly_1__6826@NODE_369_length_9158_cov_93_280497_g305_i0_p6_GENE_NODE_369_length_9158_cov_93_280497_g305_i0NODE_369_length_9158_cov_93_280497_g305_i0_p6_ORF_typecomplete_len208_score19_29ISETFN3_linker/PF16625_5/52ISETFN3_linker/PF16625_5/5_4ISETFN3_linker/PF16625_5/4_4e03_NODE_369_length_9158_cov_93_280497_g305_i051695792